MTKYAEVRNMNNGTFNSVGFCRWLVQCMLIKIQIGVLHKENESKVPPISFWRYESKQNHTDLTPLMTDFIPDAIRSGELYLTTSIQTNDNITSDSRS